MSKRRSKSKKNDRMISEQREYLHIPKPVKLKLAAPSTIKKIEDRRFYAPADTYPRGLFRRSTELVVRQPNVNNLKRKNEVPRKVVFRVPDEVAVCVRRKERREVMFALGRTGKGARARRKRTRYSDMEC